MKMIIEDIDVKYMVYKKYQKICQKFYIRQLKAEDMKNIQLFLQETEEEINLIYSYQE
jgi:hypothetical protein